VLYGYTYYLCIGTYKYAQKHTCVVLMVTCIRNFLYCIWRIYPLGDRNWKCQGCSSWPPLQPGWGHMTRLLQSDSSIPAFRFWTRHSKRSWVCSGAGVAEAGIGPSGVHGIGHGQSPAAAAEPGGRGKCGVGWGPRAWWRSPDAVTVGSWSWSHSPEPGSPVLLVTANNSHHFIYFIEIEKWIPQIHLF
jgi:hypothetical protein